jgi:FkbH-like protein
MPSLAIVSNVITKPITAYLKPLQVTHYPLDTIFETVANDVVEDILLILIDVSFFDHKGRRLTLLEQAVKHFRTQQATPLLLTTVFDLPNNFSPQSNLEHYQHIHQINKTLDQLSDTVASTYLVDLYTVAMRHGIQTLINQNNRFLFQTPFTKQGWEAVANEITYTIEKIETTRKKVLVLDADNTLWSGIAGEDGVANVKVDQNYPGIVYTFFQQQIKALKESGIVLALVSKNDAKTIDEVFATKTMPLSPDDFVMMKVNWLPKSQNIKAIADALSLGLSSFVFIDDSSFEINEVKETLGITTKQFDTQNLVSNLSLLASIPSLGFFHTTKEDREKTRLYQQEHQRSEVFKEADNIDSFIASLNIEVTYCLNDHNALARVTQLVNKTNQFNLTTRRHSESTIAKMMEEQSVYHFSVKDSFGDMGIVGVVIVANGEIDTFLLSCRVLGRKIESKILEIVTRFHPNVKATFSSTERNDLVKSFYDDHGFHVGTENESSKTYQSITVNPVTMIKEAPCKS